MSVTLRFGFCLYFTSLLIINNSMNPPNVPWLIFLTGCAVLGTLIIAFSE